MDYRVCFYISEDGFYGGKGYIQKINEEYPLPSTATWVAPEIPDGHSVFWNGESWEYEPYPEAEVEPEPEYEVE